jgi:tRNA threonylcarbamoyladenosine biosynthesis protein TsaE
MKKEFSLKDIESVAESVIAYANKSVGTSAVVLALSGDLGAGKTTLTQTIASKLGIKENIISPTFVIMKNYQLPITNYQWKRLIHIDAYRLNHSNELKTLGWDGILSDPHTLVILEWPENVPECLDEKTCHINLQHIDENTRSIEFV